MRRVVVLVCLAFLVSGCGPDRPEIPGRVEFRSEDGSVMTGSLRVADTPEERASGLMGVKSLDPEDGEVFVFDEPTTDWFWMKDTLIPLSIAFWDESGTIVDILVMEPCRTQACPKYAASAPYTTALEMNKGWFERNGIQIGDHAEFSYSSL